MSVNNKYFFEGEWKNLEKSKISIPVKILGLFRWTFKREAMRSIHGPVIRNDQGTFAIRYSGFGEVRQVEQWFKMNKAKNLDEFTDAMSMITDVASSSMKMAPLLEKMEKLEKDAER